MKYFLILMLVINLIVIVFCSQNNEKKENTVDHELGFSTGINIGEKIPEFSLLDQNGNRKELKEMIGKNGAILNFYRSASWWPYCKKELVEFQEKQNEFHKKGISIIGISYDSVNILKSFSNKYQITYPLLADINSEVIKQFGILNTTIDSDSKIFGIPYPGLFIIDRDMTVIKKQFEKSYAARPSIENILVTHFNKELDSNIHYFKNSYLTGSIAISDTLAFPAQILALVVKVSMKEDFHLYGNPIPKGYIPLTIELDTNSNFTFDKFQFPKRKK